MTTTDLVPSQPDAPPPAALFRSEEPAEIVRQASAVAGALAPVIEDRRLYTEINGRRHVRVEGWTLLGSMLGVFPVCVWSRPTEFGWEARVEARTLAGALVGAAEASCTRDEPNWRDKPDYALRSMSQTRATSKALRLPLGFVVALAGYEATPAEDMDSNTFRVRAPAHGDHPSGGNGASAAGAINRPPRPPIKEPPPRADQGPALSATEPQVRAIYAIGRGARGLDGEEVDAFCRDRFGVPPAGLSRRQASELIDALKVRRSDE